MTTRMVIRRFLCSQAGVGFLILTWSGTPSVFMQASTAQPGCEHQGAAVEGSGVNPPVLKGHPDRIRTLWLRHLPPEVFGPRRAKILVSYRVDEQGKVSSACVERGVRDVVDNAARQSLFALDFAPATRADTPVPVVVRQEIDLIRPEGRFAADVSVDVTNEKWLEQIALDPGSDPRIRKSPFLSHLYRSIQVHAFARLGELGSAEGLRAVQRIEPQLSSTELTPAIVPLGRYRHPAFHMADDPRGGVAEVDLDGVRVRFIPSSLLGGLDLFLVTSRMPSEASSWTRPLLTRVKWSWQDQNVAVSVDAQGRLLLSVGQRETVVDLSEVRKDSDGDGWTDIEEARLGLRSDRVDSDDDGLPDGRDVSPLMPISSETVSGEEEEILQRALFAVFVVAGSRHLLLVDQSSARIHLDGYGGPILYDIDPKTWLADHDSVGIRVSWKIIARTANEAAVEISNYVAPLAAGAQKVYLRKLGSRWVVVGLDELWVS